MTEEDIGACLRWEDCRSLAEEIRRLQQDNARLRALIKKAERSGACLDECPWCGFAGDTHASDCPAFTPEGEVK